MGARFTPAPEVYQRMVDQFLAVAQRGELPALTALFADELASCPDGGVVSVACQMAHGSQQVARLGAGTARMLPPARAPSLPRPIAS